MMSPGAPHSSAIKDDDGSGLRELRPPVQGVAAGDRSTDE